MIRISLTRGLEAMIDDADAPAISQYRWYAVAHGARPYAARRTYDKGKRGIVYMHRQITNCPKGKEVDHLNGDGLDNRRKNLRITTKSQNLLNSSLAIGKGFFKCKQTGRWFSRISFEGQRVMLGRFQSAEQAAAAVAHGRSLLRSGISVRDVPALVAAHVKRFNDEPIPPTV